MGVPNLRSAQLVSVRTRNVSFGAAHIPRVQTVDADDLRTR